MNGCAVCHLSIAFSLLGLTTLPCSSSAQNSIQGEHNRTTEDPCFPFRSYDGSYNEWCVIFSKGLQIWKSIALGEVDLGHPPFYFMCFIATLDNDEMKLKDTLLQFKTKVIDLSNQEAPFSSMDKTTVNLEWVLDSQTTRQELGELEKYCSNADIVYMTKSFVDRIISDESVVNTKLLTTAIESLPISNGSTYPYCENAKHTWELGCICKRLICIAGLPCGPVQCPERENPRDNCVIKTCTKCTNFKYYVPNKRTCFWNMKAFSGYH